MVLALRLHEKIGIPSWIFYGFVGSVMESFERVLTQIPCYIIVSLVTPKGIEATMVTFTSTILTFNLFTVKALIGVYIN